MDAEMYARAVERARPVVAGIKRDQLGDQTPCSDWDVRTLFNHFIGGFVSFGSAAEGRAVDLGSPEDYAEGDLVEVFDRTAGEARDAFASPGALEREFTLTSGKTPGSVVLGLALADAVVHGWDLARATGQEITIDDDIAEALYGMTSSMMQPNGSYPRGDSFADPVEVGPDAAPGDKLLAYLGRTP
jgi:uncharacterized protein (TIGR03086 family)